ncbi:MAG: acyl-CoA desaturase [Actinomycetota bacterium]
MVQTAERVREPAQEVQGVVRLDERAARFQRRAILALTIIPFVGFAFAIATLWGRGVTALDLALFLSLYVFTGLGVTVGYHRLFTHRSFDAPRPVRMLFAIAGSMAVGGSVISWVAHHRRHHAYADKYGDPHSPHLDEGEGIMGVLRGLWHAHVGWLFDEFKTDKERWARDLTRDDDMNRIDRLFPQLVIVSFALPAALGFALTGSLGGLLGGLLWGGLARVFFLHHVTWSINSICHFYGTRPFETSDYSTNNWPLALISFGESWHNNHHAFPTSAVHGLGRWQVDLSALVISALERARLATNVRRVSPDQRQAKVRRA